MIEPMRDGLRWLRNHFGGHIQQWRRRLLPVPEQSSQRQNYTLEVLEPRLLMSGSALAVPAWTSEGPNAITHGQAELGNPADKTDNLVSGGIQAIAIDPKSSNHMIVGSVSGGIWSTDDGGGHWRTSTDQFPSLQIGAVAFDQDPARSNIVYAGVGRTTSAIALSAEPIGGLFVSSDSGQNWSRLWDSKFTGLQVTKIIARGNTVLVAGIDETLGINGGVLVGTIQANGSFRWVKTPTLGNTTDLVADPNNDKQFFAGTPLHGIYRGLLNPDGTMTWTLAGAGSIDAQLPGDGHDDNGNGRDDEEKIANTGRILLAVQSIGGTTHLYASLFLQEDGDKSDDGHGHGDKFTPDDGRLLAIFHSSDAGQNWTRVANLTNAQPNPAGEGLRLSALLAHPTVANLIYVAGDESGKVYQVDVSSGTWTQIAGVPALQTAPHADVRALVISTLSGSPQLIHLSDGGIARLQLSDAGAPVGNWTSLNGDLEITEVRRVALDPVNQVILAGTQDNGSIEERTGLSWDAIRDGDGNTQAVAQVGDVLRRYTLGNNLKLFQRHDFNLSGQPLGEPKNVLLAARLTPADALSGLVPADKSFDGFTSIPYAVNGHAGQQNRMLLGLNGLYVSTDGLDHITKIPNAGSGLVTALAYGNDVNADVMYVARGNTIYARTTASGAFTKSLIGAADKIWDIVIDHSNASVAYAVSSFAVFRTTDAGKHWQNIAGKLRTDSFRGTFSLGLAYLRTVELVNTGGQSFLLVGGMGGVFRAANVGVGTTEWSEFGRNLPNVLVTDLHYDRANGGTLIAGTLGRGVWKMTGVDGQVGFAAALIITGTTGPDQFRLVRDAGNPTLLDVFKTVGGSETLDDQFQLSTIQTISFSGEEGDDRLILDTTFGAIIAPGIGSGLSRQEGIQFFGGDGNDTLLVVQGGRQRGVRKIDATHADVVGGGGVQRIKLLDVEQPSLQAPVQNAPLAAAGLLTTDDTADLLDDVHDGLQILSNWSFQLDDPTLLSQNVPLFGSSLGRALNGLIAPSSEEEPNDRATGPDNAITGQNSQLLRRIFETGTGAFNLDEITADGTINTLEALRDALDALDSTPGNVVLTQENGVTRFDVHVTKTLEGVADIDAAALGGNVQLSGSMKFSTDVAAHLVLGVDTNGFFIDAEGNLDPELTFSHFQLLGDVTGGGQIGFLGVDLKDGTLTVDPAVRVAVNLHDPGTDQEEGVIRLDELQPISNDLATAELLGGPAGGSNDLEFTGSFGVSAFDFGLLDARIALKWASINDLASVQVSALPGAGEDLLRFLNVTADQIFTGLGGLASFLQQAGGANLPGGNLLNTKIPLLNQSLQDVLNGVVNSFDLDNGKIIQVSDVFADGTFSKFSVDVQGTNLLKEGIAVGNKVTYKGAGTSDLFDGVIDSVSVDSFTVRFDQALTQTPDTTATAAFHIFRAGSIQNQLNSILGDLSDPATVSLKVPTLQDLVAELADRTGLDFLNQVKLTGSGDSLALEIPFSFAPDPIQLSQHLDLGGTVAGLSLESSGNFDFTIAPQFHLDIGLRLAPDVSLSDRFFIVADDQPEVKLDIKAQLDNPSLKGSFGFLDVILHEDGATSPNAGIVLTGTVAVNLVDPGTNAANDGRIFFGELHPSDGSGGVDLGKVFAPAISAMVDIDGLKLSANVGNSTLGALTFSLDGNTDGKITSLADLEGLAQKIADKIQLDSDFSAFNSFNNITPEVILSVLSSLIEKLKAVGHGAAFDKQLPLINKSLADIVNLGDALLKKLDSDPATPGLQVGDQLLDSAGKLQAFLDSKLGAGAVTVQVNPGDVRFAFHYSDSIDTNLPFAFNLMSGGSLLSLVGDGSLAVHAQLGVSLTLGLTTAAGVDLLDRVFLDSTQANEIAVSATADAGYDLNDDGDLMDSNEGAPLSFKASVGPLNLRVDNARALINLALAADIKDGSTADGKLTLKEIADGPISSVISGSFDGSIQAIIPLTTQNDPAHHVSTDPATLSPDDALIDVAGSLRNLDNIVFDTDVAHHTGATLTAGNAADPATADVTDPLQVSELDATRFLVFAHNLDGLIANGFFNFSSLIDGLDRFAAWADKLLGIDVLNFKLPFVGESLHDALNFVQSDDPNAQTLRRFVDEFKTNGAAGLGTTGTTEAVLEAAALLRNTLAQIPGVIAITDADGDGVLEQPPTSGDDLLRIERGSTVTPAAINDAIVVVNTDGSFVVTKGSLDFLKQGAGIAVGDTLHYTGANSGTLEATGTVIEVAADHLRVKMADASNPPVDKDSGTPAVEHDVTVDSREVVGATFLLKFAPSVDVDLFTLPSMDLGLDFLNLQSDTQIKFHGDLSLLLGFGITKSDGFFIKTDFSDLGLPADTKEFSLNGRIELDGKVAVKLGFLNLMANFDEAGPEDDFMSANFSADLHDPSGKLNLADLLDFGKITNEVDVQMVTAARMAAPLSVGAGSDLPSLSTDLLLNWGPFNLIDVARGGANFAAPEVDLNNIRINAGDFLTKVAKPIFENIDRYNFLKTVIDALNTPLPLIGETPFDLLVRDNPNLSDQERNVANFLFNVAHTISDTAANVDAANTHDGNTGLFIDFGNIKVSNDNGAAVDTSGGFEDGKVDGNAVNTAPVPGANLPVIGGFLSDLGKLGITFPVLKLSNLAQLLVGHDIDLAFVELPKAPGKEHAIDIHKDFNITIPIFSFGIPVLAQASVEAFIGGGFGFFADLTAGFDTSGLHHGRFLDGFYLGDFDPGSNHQIDPTDHERPEVGFDAEVHVGVDAKGTVLGFDVAKITGQGEIGGRLTADFNDDNEPNTLDQRTAAQRHDGRVHADEILTILGTNGNDLLCLFDLSGQLFASLSLKINVDLFLVSFSKTFKKEWTLADFTLSCSPPVVDLANIVGNTLVLTSTNSAADGDLITRAGTNNRDGDSVQILLIDKDNNLATGVDGKETLRVQKNGVHEDFGPNETETAQTGAGPFNGRIDDIQQLKLITDEGGGPLNGFGAGDDAVFVDPGIRIPVRLSGGEGNDTLTGGAGGGILLGGEGDDSLSFAAVAGVPGAILIGGGGDDVLNGGAGDDLIVGDYDATRDPRPLNAQEGSDVIGAGDGNDTIWGDNSSSPDPDLSRKTDDVIFAGGGNDVVHAGPGDDRVEADAADAIPGAGDDIVFGEAGNDIINGHGGSDHLVGQAGDDTIDGGFGNDSLYGGNDTLGPDQSGLGVDTLRGDEGDDLVDGSDSISVTAAGGDGSDTILGSRGADYLFGDAGRDFIVGGPNNDTIRAGDGDDDVVGGKGTAGQVTFQVTGFPADGADTIDGGAGDDVLLGDNGVIVASSRAAQTDPTDGGGIDTISGGTGNDIIFGGSASDKLTGDDVSGTGNDVIVGDQGSADASRIQAVSSPVAGSSGDDLISGSGGDDILLGGDGQDTITGDGVITDTTIQLPADFNLPSALQTGGGDIILGDNGVVVLNDGSADANDVFSNGITGDSDTIDGGPGNDILVGGAADDSILGGDGEDVLAGDNAHITRDSANVVVRIETSFEDSGGDDHMAGGSGADVALGGFGNDIIQGGGEDDILLGDNGVVVRNDGSVDANDIFSRSPALGGIDTIHGDSGNDVIIGGSGGDDLSSQAAGDGDLLFGDDGADIILGDNARVTRDSSNLIENITTTFPDQGGDDTLEGDAGDDILLGGFGSDAVSGNDGNDVLLGDNGLLDYRVDSDMALDLIKTTDPALGASDVLSGGAGDDFAFGGTAGDSIDGGSGRDILLGDHGELRLGFLSGSPLDRLVGPGGTLYTSAGSANVSASPQLDPNGGTPPDVKLYDFSPAAPDPKNFGDDVMAGGSGDDLMFGQIGNDQMQGDASVAETVSAVDVPGAAGYDPSVGNAAADGNDYMEGNSGNDLMFGDLGQDSMIGGSSDLFGLTSSAQRPDGQDFMFGGAGTEIGRNHQGNVSAEGHAQDADVMLGDNGRIFTIVKLAGAGPATVFETFNYDNYSSTRIRPRAFDVLDYSPDGNDSNDIGAPERIHGEAGDDIIAGMTGNDTLFGEGQDDDLIGGIGNDWISGGTGSDGVLGDDGRIFTRRNPLAEPLYGIAAIPAAQQNLTISTPGHHQQSVINVTGVLTKSVDLEPFDQGGNDIIYGGLGNDWLHGGAGDDAISGAEALTTFYSAPNNPGNILNFGGFGAAKGYADPTEFADYDQFHPLTKIQGFVLNFEAYTDPANQAGTKVDDGADVLFGDTGNDWLVGGTNHDVLFGGAGSDLQNTDDNQDTAGGLNNTQDAAPFADADIAYGGAGRDVLIDNTTADRLIDWVGEFNSYIVPYSQFGEPSVSRTLQPQLQEYLYALSASLGADQTRIGPGLGTPQRNGEPFGELGVVIQSDPGFQDQTGAPSDPQPGHTSGSNRTVVSAADFNDGGIQGFAADIGTGTVLNGRYQVAPSVAGGDALSVFQVESFLPSYFEILAAVDAVKPTGGMNANAYLVFDYQSATNFKFAGVNVSTNKLEIGHRTAQGWIIDAQGPFQTSLKSDTDYNLFLALNGTTATLKVNNASTLSVTFALRTDAFGIAHALNDGLVGLGARNAKAQIDNVVVQQPTTLTTLNRTDDFTSGVSDLFQAPLLGSWSTGNARYVTNSDTNAPAIDLFALKVAPSSLVDLSATLQTTGSGGFVYDQLGSTDFKFVAISVATKQIVMGHRTSNGWFTDAAITYTSLAAGVDFTLGVTLKDSVASVSVNGQVLMSHSYNSIVTDGAFGLLSQNGRTSFDRVTVKTDDPALSGSSPVGTTSIWHGDGDFAQMHPIFGPGTESAIQ